DYYCQVWDVRSDQYIF
nr:immunoglobulin light chain junction region [Macaca mulatta]MOW16708.1 immunoglobulin light chain junction region [Macaca mulatta]